MRNLKQQYTDEEWKSLDTFSGWLVNIGKKKEDKTPSTIQKLPEVNRVEVIDSTGRVYTNYSAQDVEISFQDNQRTLKIFLK